MDQTLEISKLQTQLKELQEVGQLAYWEYAPEEQAFILNDEAFSLLHTTVEKEGGYILNESFIARYVHPEDWPLLQKQFKAALKSKDPDFLTQAEYRIIRADGQTRVFSIRLKAKIAAYGKPSLYGAIQDITERRTNEQELLQFKLGIDRSDAAIFLTGVDGHIQYVNPAFTHTYGYTQAEAVGQTPRILKSGVIPPERYAEFWQNLLSRQVVAGEIINKTKDGRLLTIEGSNNPILSENGELIGFLSVHRDITFRKQTEKALLTSEQTVQEILDKQRELHKIGLQLARANNLDTLYHQAVELGRRHLGFERLGLFILDEATQTVQGTYGIGPDGSVRAEKDNIVNLNTEPLFRNFLYNQERLIVDPNADLYDNGQIVGQGWHMTAALWTANKPVGLLFADGLLSSDPPKPYQSELLSAYATTIAQVVFNKQNELSTRENEALLTSLLDAIPDLIFYKDVHGVYAGCNDAFVEFVGRSKNELVGKTDFDLFPQDVAAFFREQDDEMMSLGKPRRNEEWAEYPDGRRVRLDTLKTPFYNQQGDLMGLIGISRDITAVHQSQEELTRMSYVVGQSLDGTAIANLDGKIIYANNAWAKMHGYEAAELIGKHLSMFHTEEQLAQEVDPFNAAVIEFGSQEQEIGHVHRDGTTFPTLMGVTLLRDSNGQPVNLAAWAKDITARKQAEEEIAQHDADMQIVAEISTTVGANLSNQQDLLQNVVDLTKERFGFYHVAIYLFDASQKRLTLAVGAGNIGRQIAAQKEYLPLTQENSLPARVTRTRRGQTLHDLLQEQGYVIHPLLPNARSEMAIPLIAGDQLLGVLDAFSEQPARFDQEDINIHTTLAAQTAIGLENARLLSESQRAVEELNNLMRRLTRESWDSYLQEFETEETKYTFSLGEDLLLAQEMDNVVPATAVLSADEQPDTLMRQALTIHGESVGQLTLYRDIEDYATLGDEAAEIIAAVAAQLSSRIENIRLTNQTQAALSLTERLYDAGRRLNTAGPDLQQALAAISEAAPIPTVNRIVLFMFENNAQGEMEAIVSAANWYKGSGTPPTTIGVRYERDMMAALNLLQTHEPLTFENAIHDGRIDPVTRTIFERLNIKSLVVLPLWVGARQLGSLLLESEELHKYTDREIEPYTSLTAQLAVLVDRQRLLSEAELRAERERQIRTITDKIRRGIDRQAILQVAREEISQMLGAQTAVAQLGTAAQLLERLHAQNTANTPDNHQ